MADVSAITALWQRGHEREADGERANHRDRAQILLVTALALSVAFVVIALFLNSVIYTENLATRSEGIGQQEAASYEARTAASFGDLVSYVNYNRNDTESTLEAGLAAGQDNISNLSRRYAVDTGHVTNVSLSDHREATRIAQYADDGFNDTNGNWNWVVADDVPELRRFRLNVSRGTLNDVSVTSLTGSAYVNLTDDDGETWRVWIYRDTGLSPTATLVQVEDPSGSLSTPCSDGTGDRTHISISNASVAGEPCQSLEIFGDADFDRPFSVGFNQTNAGSPRPFDELINGSYELVIRKSVLSPPNDPYSGPNAFPETYPAIWDVTTRITFQSENLYVQRDVTAEPGPPEMELQGGTAGGGGGGGGGSGTPPSIDTFDVEDRSKTNGGNQKAWYRLSWSVSDPENDVQQVTIRVYNDGSLVQTYAGVGANGNNFDYEASGEDEEAHQIEIEATDTNSNTVCVNRDGIADDDDTSAGEEMDSRNSC